MAKILVDISDRNISVSVSDNIILEFKLTDTPLSINRIKSIAKQIKRDSKVIRENNIKVSINGLDKSLKLYSELFEDYNTEYNERLLKFNYLSNIIKEYKNVEVNDDIINYFNLLKKNNKLGISKTFDIALNIQESIIQLSNEIANIKNNISSYKDLIEINRKIKV